MFGKSLILIATALAPIVRRLVKAAMEQDDEQAKHALVDLMVEAKKEAIKGKFR